jgi:PAS domain S-box-containing protein
MKIATRLKFNALLFTVAVFNISLVFALAFRLHGEAFERSMVADEVMQGSYELNSLSNRYLRYPEERPKEQWMLVYDALTSRLSSDALAPLHSSVIIRRMRQDLSDMRSLFNDLVQIDGKLTAEGRARADADMVERQRALIADLIISGSRDVSLDASRLVAVSNTQVSNIGRRIGLLLPAAGILLTAATIWVTTRISRSIHRGIDVLRTGADAVALGNLDYRIGLRTQDELGQLSNAFDRMTSGLKAITVSRTELLNEMAERRRAEDALQENQRFLQTIIDSAPACIKLVASDGTLLKMNDAGLRMIEAGSSGQVEGKSIYPLVSSKYRRAFIELTDKVFQGESGTLEFEAVSLKGRGLWLNTHAVPLYDNEGRISALLGITMDTTERKRTEEALRISEENYRAIFNASGDGIFIHDLDTGAILDVNRTVCRMYKYSFEEMHALSVQDLSAGTPGYTQDDALRVIGLAARGEPQIFEWRARDKNGELFWVEVSLRRVTLEGRERLLAIVRDISERKRVETEFRKISRQNELILEHAGEGIFGLDLLGRVTFVNAVAAHMLGYTRRELMGSHSHSTWHYKMPDNAPYPSQECPIYAAYNEGKIRSGEEVFWKKDGSGFPVEFTSRPLYENNRITGAVVVYRDITERKRAEEELRESEERFRATYEQAAVGIELIGLNGVYISGNGKLGQMLGYSEAELKTLSFDRITNPDDLLRERPLVSALTEERLPSYSMEKRYLDKKGNEIWVRVTSSIARTAKPYRISIIEDITERKQAEEDLKRLLSELERSNKELEQFAYVASHDLQEPLRMVASYVQLLERKYKSNLDEKADKYIFFAVDGVKRMQKLIDGLLAYSRVSRGAQFTAIDADGAMDQAVAGLSVSIRENQAAVTRDRLPRVKADETQLSQVFQNLIANAIKFRKRDVAPAVHVSAIRTEREWVFSVRDNGIGIESQYYDKIFQIFQRLHGRDEYPGTGIGLSLCKRIIERHGGRMWLESEPGKGSTFFFTIPLREKRGDPALAA